MAQTATERDAMNDAGHDLVLGMAGHIDHGKTALVRALTGVDTDRLPAEKQRGITIDLGFAPLRLGAYQLAVIDVPGHERFIRNMLAGASGLDLAMLSRRGRRLRDAPDPRTPGDPSPARALGRCGRAHEVRPGRPGLARSRRGGCQRLGAWNLSRECARSCGPRRRPVRAWSSSKTRFTSVCATVKPIEDPGVFRMAIDRSFTVAGHGTVVTGTVASGSVAVGDELEWQPGRADRAGSRLAPA